MAGVRTIERTRLSLPLLDRRAVALVAPGGYGKSTLAEQVLARWGLVTVRVRLRAPTSEAELVEALRRGARRTGLADLAAAAVAPEPIVAVDELIEAALARAEPFAVLVDDVQLLAPGAWALLDGLLADVPVACRSIVCGRWLPDRLVELRDVAVLRVDELRMTHEEVATVLGGEGLPSVVDDLHRATDGWPAAVAIGAERLRLDPGWSPSARSAGVRLLTGLIEPLVGDDRAATVRMARVPLLDERVAELVAGPGALERLARSALPNRSDQGRWTVIPDAVRDALLAIDVAGTELDVGTVAAIARHYADRGELAAAAQLAAEAGTPEVLADLLSSRHWTDLEALGLTPLAQLVASIPDDVLAAEAGLLVDAALAAEAHRPALRRAWLERLASLPGADPVARRAGDAERARDLVRSVRLDDASRLAEDVLRAAAPDELVTRGRAELAIAHAHAFTSTEDSYDVAQRRFEVAAELLGLAGEHRLQAEALARLGYNVLFHRGRPTEAAARLEHALALLPTGDRTRAMWLTSYADVLDWLGDAARCDAAVAEAIEIGGRLRDHGVLGFAHWTRAWTLGRRGDLPGLRAALAEVERLRPGWLDQGNGVEFYGSLADLFVALGDERGLRHCRARATELGERLGYPQAVAMMDARIEAIQGDAAAALIALAELDRSVGAATNTRWVRRLEGAVAALRLGDLAGARRHAEEAIALATDMGLPDLPRRFEPALVQRLAPVWPSDEPEAAQTRTTVTMLGTFAVRAGHRDVTPPSGHPSTLLKLLVLRRTMTVDAAIDALWPDVDVDTGRARLRNTMNRLRTRSGPLVERRGDTLELAPSVQADVDVFERAAADALAAEASMRVGLARQAIALHTGELLPGDAFEDWAAAPRERLLRRYLALVDLVAAAAAADGNHDEAARLLDLGIAADPLDEARYVRLAGLLREQGRAHASRQIAERGLGVFADLGVPPSAELRHLAG